VNVLVSLYMAYMDKHELLHPDTTDDDLLMFRLFAAEMLADEGL